MTTILSLWLTGAAIAGAFGSMIRCFKDLVAGGSDIRFQGRENTKYMFYTTKKQTYLF